MAVLKIIGLSLLGLLVFVLLCLCLILLVPVRYYGKGEYRENVFLKARVSWLLRAVQCKFELKNDQPELVILLFGFLKINPGGGKRNDPEKENGEETRNIKKSKEEKQKKKEKKKEKIPFRERLRKGKDRFLEIKNYKDDPRVQNAVSEILPEIKKMILRIFPKNAEGDLHFGFQDPFLTGQVLGIFAMLYPVTKKKLLLYPDFENAVVSGALSFDGRIFLGTLVFYAIKIFLKKDTVYMIRETRKLFKKEEEAANVEESV